MADEYFPQIVFAVEETAARRKSEQLRISQSWSTEAVDNCSRWKAEQLHVSQARSTETVEETTASRKDDRLPTSRARAEETAGEAAARQKEDQHQTAAARGGERLDPVDNVDEFTHNCRDIRPVH